MLLTPYVTRLVGPIALQDGPDAAQEALIAIFRGIGSVRDPDALFGWARTIAVREAVRVAQRARRSVVAELDDVPAPGDPLLTARCPRRRLSGRRRARLPVWSPAPATTFPRNDRMSYSPRCGTATTASRCHILDLDLT